MPWALTEIEPPTEKMSVDCMAFTANFGCSMFWMSCQVAPGCTVMVIVASSTETLLNCIMSSTSALSSKAWPPIEWRTAAMEIFRLLALAKASASAMSASSFTATTP